VGVSHNYNYLQVHLIFGGDRIITLPLLVSYIIFFIN